MKSKPISKYKLLFLLKYPNALCVRLKDDTYGIVTDRTQYSKETIEMFTSNYGNGYKTENQAWAYAARKKRLLQYRLPDVDDV